VKSRWIDYKGTRIFYVDFSNFRQNRDPLKAELEAMSSVVRQEPESSVLGLVDLRNTFLSTATTLLIQNYAWRLGRHIHNAAVIVDTVNYPKTVIVNSITRVGGKEVVLFDNVEEAKDWLVDDKQ
jgi:hypothetical protein